MRIYASNTTRTTKAIATDFIAVSSSDGETTKHNAIIVHNDIGLEAITTFVKIYENPRYLDFLHSNVLALSLSSPILLLFHHLRCNRTILFYS